MRNVLLRAILARKDHWRVHSSKMETVRTFIYEFSHFCELNNQKILDHFLDIECVDRDPNLCKKFTKYCAISTPIFGVRIDEYCPVSCNSCTRLLRKKLESYEMRYYATSTTTKPRQNSRPVQYLRAKLEGKCEDKESFCPMLIQHCDLPNASVRGSPIPVLCPKTCDKC